MSNEARFPLPEGYSLIRHLGAGSMGSTLLLKDADGKRVVCKEVLKERLGSKEKVQLFKERIESIKSLNNKYIVPFSGVIEDETRLLLMRAYLNDSNILTNAHKIKAMGNNKIIALWSTLARTLHTLHTHHLAPNLLRGSNLFLFNDSCIVITDLYPSMTDINIMVHNPDPMELGFLAPEFLTPGAPPTYKADNWSLGVILAFFVTGEFPYNTKNVFSVLQQINTATLQYSGEIPEEIDSIIKRLVKVNPDERAELSDIVKMSAPLKSRMTAIRTAPRNVTELKLPKNKQFDSVMTSRGPTHLSLASYMVIGVQSTDQVLRTYDVAELPNFRIRQATHPGRTSTASRKPSQFLPPDLL